MKTEVYSWRLSTDLKTELEHEARRRKMSLSAVLDMAAHDLLSKRNADMDGDEEQLSLHKAAAKCFGTIAGGDAHRSENTSRTLRQRLRQRYDR